MAKKKVSRKKTATKPTLEDILIRLERIEGLLKKEESEEKLIEQEEAAEVSALEKLERLEEEIKHDVAPHPLRRITYHDITKGMIGAFIGVVGHFAFIYGNHIAEGISTSRATLLLALSLGLLVVFLYFSGFRRVKEYTRYLPIRVFVIYITALVVATAVLFIFDILHFPIDWHELYLNVGALSVLAVMGAATADLLGGE